MNVVTKPPRRILSTQKSDAGRTPTLVQNLPWPLFAKEGKWSAKAISPFEKGKFKGDFLSGEERARIRSGWAALADGYPVRMTDAGGSTQEVLKAEERTVSATEFAPPAGFTKKPFSDLAPR